MGEKEKQTNIQTMENKTPKNSDVSDESDEDEEERYCDNEDCPYEGYCYGDKKKELEGKPYICVGCETGKGLQEREAEECDRCGHPDVLDCMSNGCHRVALWYED